MARSKKSLPAATPLAAGLQAGGVEWRPSASLRRHPQGGLVPEVSPEGYRTLRADIDRRGLLVPLEITAAGVVLDGHLRLRAAEELELEQLPVRVIAPADEVEYLLLAALQRRQLSASQRAALAVELERYRRTRQRGKQRQRQNLRQHTEEAKLPPRGKTRELAAAWAGVSPRTVQDAATVQQADPALFAQVKAGKLSAEVAARRVRRRQRDAALPAAPPLPQGPFELIYADPPWQLGNPDARYAPESYYPTLSLEQIKRLPVPAAANAFLALWAVTGLLPEALEVIDAWGFEYRSALIWVKPAIKLGNWARNRHETLLLARKGSFPPPEPEDRADSVITAPCGRHSQKPAVFYQLLETMYPTASKLELFARGKPHPGWAAWGNESEPA